MHLFRIGSTTRFIEPLVSLAGRTNFIALGDSITAGQNASNAASRFVNRFTTLKGLTLNNLGVGGRGVYQAAVNIQGATFTRSNTVISFMAGLNDMRRGGVAAATLKKIEACLRTSILRGISNVNTPSGSASVTRVGTIGAFAANTVGGFYPSGTLPGPYATNATSTSASWTYTFTGTSFGIQFSCSDDVVSSYGHGEIFIDGVKVKDVELGEWYDGISDGANANNRGPMAMTFHGLSSGLHTVLVQKNGGGNFPIDFFCTLQTPANAAAFMVAEIPYLNSTGYAQAPANGSVANSDICSNLLRSIVNEYASYGYNITFVKTNDFYVLATGLDTDNIHPNDTGHVQIRDAYLAAVYN